MESAIGQQLAVLLYWCCCFYTVAHSYCILLPKQSSQTPTLPFEQRLGCLTCFTCLKTKVRPARQARVPLFDFHKAGCFPNKEGTPWLPGLSLPWGRQVNPAAIKEPHGERRLSHVRATCVAARAAGSRRAHAMDQGPRAQVARLFGCNQAHNGSFRLSSKKRGALKDRHTQGP